MMFLSLAVLTLSTVPLQAAPDPRVAVFGEACLGSLPATREGLASLASRKNWRKVDTVTPGNLVWRDYYRAGQATVRLDQHRAADGNPGERICVVLVGAAPGNWRAQVSGLSAAGARVGDPGTYDTNVYQLPPGLELTVWDLPDGSRIHALREPDNTLELSINYPTGR